MTLPPQVTLGSVNFTIKTKEDKGVSNVEEAVSWAVFAESRQF